MINHPIPINFLRHVYSESVTDVANIVVAEAQDDYDTIIKYLSNMRDFIGNWIAELETDKRNKENEK
jgi:hypothetical protein